MKKNGTGLFMKPVAISQQQLDLVVEVTPAHLRWAYEHNLAVRERESFLMCMQSDVMRHALTLEAKAALRRGEMISVQKNS